MNCAEFEEILHDLDRPGTPGLGMREGALMHAESCEHCALRMIEAESLDFGLRQLALEDADKQARRSIETTLLAEFRLQKAARSKHRVRWQVAALAAAAMLLLALGISLRHRIGEQPNLAGVAPAQTNANQPSPLHNAANSNTQDSAANEGGQTTGDDSSDEYASAFIPLPFADDPDAVEDGAVVRVVMTRSALASLGLPSLAVGNSDEIPADLVLNDDGTPEAIRLVSETAIE